MEMIFTTPIRYILTFYGLDIYILVSRLPIVKCPKRSVVSTKYHGIQTVHLSTYRTVRHGILQCGNAHSRSTNI